MTMNITHNFLCLDISVELLCNNHEKKYYLIFFFYK